MRDDWYYSVSGEEIGPVTLQRLRDILSALPHDGVFVWHESFPDRLPASDIAKLIADEKLPNSVSASASPNEAMEFAIESDLYSAIAGFVLGGFVILLGCFVFYLGITGKEKWTAGVLGSSSTLVDALPGAVLFVIGLLVIWVTRYKQTVK